VQDTKIRRENADYLTAHLKEIPGITPVRLPANSKAVWHLYPVRYDAQQFKGLPRQAFINALHAEGIPCGGGYHEQYFDGIFDEATASRGFKRLFSEQRLKANRDSFQELAGNRQVCDTTVAFYQSMLLAPRSDMDHIIHAVRKVQANSEALAKSV